MEPVLGEVLEDVLGELLAFGCEPVLHLCLVRQQDLLHALEDHFVSLDVGGPSLVAALRPSQSAAVSKVPAV